MKRSQDGGGVGGRLSDSNPGSGTPAFAGCEGLGAGAFAGLATAAASLADLAAFALPFPFAFAALGSESEAIG
eukprot:14156823-Alexandrium_andersonii.AAC.1